MPSIFGYGRQRRYRDTLRDIQIAVATIRLSQCYHSVNLLMQESILGTTTTEMWKCRSRKYRRESSKAQTMASIWLGHRDEEWWSKDRTWTKTYCRLYVFFLFSIPFAVFFRCCEYLWVLVKMLFSGGGTTKKMWNIGCGRKWKNVNIIKKSFVYFFP